MMITSESIANKFCTFVMQGRYCSVPLLTSTIPELKTNVEAINDPILKGKIISYSGYGVLFVLFPFQPANQRCFSNNTLPNKTNFYQFVNIPHLFFLRKHLHKRIVDIGLRFIKYFLTCVTQYDLIGALLTQTMTALVHFGSAVGDIVSEIAFGAVHTFISINF